MYIYTCIYHVCNFVIITLLYEMNSEQEENTLYEML